MMTKILQKKTVKLKCPHCKSDISDAWICEMDSIIGMRYAIICSNCQKLLSISPNKEQIIRGNESINQNILNT